MGQRTLLTGIFFAWVIATTSLADSKAITTVTRALPSPSPKTLPVLPRGSSTALTSVRFDEIERFQEAIPQTKYIDLSAFGIPCGASVSAHLVGKSAYLIRITDSCRPHEKVSLSVSGLQFGMALSMTGNAQFHLPAFAKNSKLETVFEDNAQISTQLPNVDLSKMTRVALSWTEGEAPSLDAQNLDVITIGDGPQLLQVLTQQRIDTVSETVRLKLVREVTATSCDQAARGHVFRQTGDESALRYDLTLAPVSCSRVGETLELKNVLEDLKLATN